MEAESVSAFVVDVVMNGCEWLLVCAQLENTIMYKIKSVLMDFNSVQAGPYLLRTLQFEDKSGALSSCHNSPLSRAGGP